MNQVRQSKTRATRRAFVIALSITLMPSTQMCWSKERDYANAGVTTNNSTPQVQGDPWSRKVFFPYGWEFFGLTKEELVKEVEAINGRKNGIYRLNEQGTNLFMGASLAGKSWDFEYSDGRISKVTKRGFGGLDQYYGPMESRSQALSLAIADHTMWIEQSQKRLARFLIEGDYSHSGWSQERALNVYFGELRSRYVQRGMLYEENGQNELAESDYRAAEQNRLEYEEQKASIAPGAQ